MGVRVRLETLHVNMLHANSQCSLIDMAALISVCGVILSAKAV